MVLIICFYYLEKKNKFAYFNKQLLFTNKIKIKICMKYALQFELLYFFYIKTLMKGVVDI